MKNKLAMLLATAMMISCVSCGNSGNAPSSSSATSSANSSSSQAEDVYTLRFGTASLGSTVQLLCSGMCAIVNDNVPTIKASAMTTQGSNEDMRLLADKDIEFGASNLDALYDAYYGTGYFEGEKIDFYNVATNFQLYYVFCAMENSGITKMEDLAGKKVCVGPAGSGTVPIAEAILKSGYGIYDDCEIVYAEFGDMPDMLKDGVVDAMIEWGVGVTPSSDFAQLDTSADIVIMGFSDEAISNVLADYPYLASDVLSGGGKLKNQPDDLNVILNYDANITRPDVPEDVVYNFVKTYYEHASELEAYHAAAAEFITPENALKAMQTLPEIPVHPGAAKYFQEIGVWDDTLIIGEVK